jgi:hypothetical protein
MEDRGCMRDSSIKSFLPGKGANDLDVRGGTFCLLKYKDGDCNCIESSTLFFIDMDMPQNCISVDGDFGSHSWERTYDWRVSCFDFGSTVYVSNADLM